MEKEWEKMSFPITIRTNMIFPIAGVVVAGGV